MSRQSISDAYDRAADHYDAWLWQRVWSEVEEPWVRSHLERAGRVDMCLDVGTGTGRYLPVLASQSRAVVGVDLSGGMLAHAASKLRATDRAVLAHAESMPIQSASVDVAVAARIMSHLASLEPFLAELSRVTKPGGLMILADVDGDHDYDGTRLPTATGRIPVDTYRRTSDEVSCVLRAMGFIIVANRLVRHSDVSPGLRSTIRLGDGNLPLCFQMVVRNRPAPSDYSTNETI